MNSFLLALGVAILLVSFIPSSDAVRSCYSGTQLTAVSTSTAPAQLACSDTSIFCYKYIETGTKNPNIKKGCINECEEKHFKGDGIEVINTCCTSDNCNFSATVLSNKILTGLGILIALCLSLKL